MAGGTAPRRAAGCSPSLPGGARRSRSLGGRAWAPQNKGMKLTSVEHIGRSQLIPGVRRTGGREAIAGTGRSRRRAPRHAWRDPMQDPSPPIDVLDVRAASRRQVRDHPSGRASLMLADRSASEIATFGTTGVDDRALTLRLFAMVVSAWPRDHSVRAVAEAEPAVSSPVVLAEHGRAVIAPQQVACLLCTRIVREACPSAQKSTAMVNEMGVKWRAAEQGDEADER